jgi:hypothetical protein
MLDGKLDSILDYPVIHNHNLHEDTEVGLHPCVLTGVFSDAYPNFTEVVLKNGIRQYARICFSFPMFAVPTKDWIEKHKNLIVGYVGFEKGFPDRALLLAITLKEGEENLVAYPNSVNMLSVIFSQVMDDKAKKFVIDLGEGKYYLGSGEASEAMLLGNKLVDMLEDLTDIIGDIATSISTLTVNTISIGSPSSPPLNLSQFVAAKTKLSGLKARYKASLSKKAFLE